MIELSMSGVVTGHAEIRINEDDPADRQKLAEKVTELLHAGHAVFVTTGQGEDQQDLRVSGYDPESNEWILTEGKPAKKKTNRRPAKGTSATSVGQVSGGCV